jgi:hypothetical protein
MILRAAPAIVREVRVPADAGMTVRFGWVGRLVERAFVRPSLSAILDVSLGRFRRRIVTERVARRTPRTLT